MGALLTGVFAVGRHQRGLRQGRRRATAATGAIDGNWHQILNQAVGAASAGGIAIVGTLVLLFVVDKTMGLRVSAADEASGLDLSQHGEEGYDFNA